MCFIIGGWRVPGNVNMCFIIEGKEGTGKCEHVFHN